MRRTVHSIPGARSGQADAKEARREVVSAGRHRLILHAAGPVACDVKHGEATTVSARGGAADARHLGVFLQLSAAALT